MPLCSTVGHNTPFPNISRGEGGKEGHALMLQKIHSDNLEPTMCARVLKAGVEVGVGSTSVETEVQEGNSSNSCCDKESLSDVQLISDVSVHV